MITFYATPRAFEGEFDKLQRTAILSWKSAMPKCEIMLMGDEPGTKEMCEEHDLRHVPQLATNDQGTPLISSAFQLAEKLAKYATLCENNADIVLGGDFEKAMNDIKHIQRPFMVGQRWDISAGAKADTAVLHPPSGVDYFIYRRDTIPVDDIPPFAVGRTIYDNWLVWSAINVWNMTVIDATDSLTAIHINHGYPKWENGKKEMMVGLERQENHRLARESGCRRWCGTNDAPHVLVNGTISKREA